MSILVCYIIFIILTFFATLSDYDNTAVTPRQLYECTDLNIFACTLVFIFAFVIDPLFFILHFIDWMMHFGRKWELKMEYLVIALFLAFVGMSFLCYHINYTWWNNYKDLNYEWAERCTKINDAWKQFYNSLLNDSGK